jgi:adenylate cyclase
MQFLTRAQGRVAAMVAIVLLATGYAWLGKQYWHPMRSSVFDAYQRTFPRKLERLPVVIVDIDEASLVALGQWPWPRSRLARLIEATYASGLWRLGST